MQLPPHRCPSSTPPSVVPLIASELTLAPRQVEGALALFDEGNTLPFIARYRKEATGGLDEVQLRDVRDRAQYLRELDERRAAILKSIDEQGKLDPALAARIDAATTKQALEDLYLPYKPKRRTRAMIARERGLEPLAELLWTGTTLRRRRSRPTRPASSTPRRKCPTSSTRSPARATSWPSASPTTPTCAARCATLTRAEGVMKSRVATGKKDEVSKFQDYYDFSEPLTRAAVASHARHAARRGRRVSALLGRGAGREDHRAARPATSSPATAAPAQMRLVVRDAYKRLLAPAVEVDLRLELKTKADEEAIAIFGRNLEQLLLAPPAGERVVIGLDPGFRTGVKVAALSRTGAVVATDTWMLHQPDRFVAALLARDRASSTRTSSRSATAPRRARRRRSCATRSPSESCRGRRSSSSTKSGASVYSASDVAREELPDLDVTLRGAVSIARRLQDPLAELVKIDPKSIGVGQYQHDVSQPRLKQRLDEVVESCVNRVGVEVNTASAPLLSYVAGIGPTLAAEHREDARRQRRLPLARRPARRAAARREGVRAGRRIPARARRRTIRSTRRPCTPSATRSSSAWRRTSACRSARSSATTASCASASKLERYVGDDVGLPTLQDILAELKKPGRDPREAFEPPAFRDDVTEPKHLTPRAWSSRASSRTSSRSARSSTSACTRTASCTCRSSPTAT